MTRVVVIADDVSGAAELAAAALSHGLTAEVQTELDPTSTANVICLDTETRSVAPERAAAIAGELAARIGALQPDWIFKKCDSVLRGPVLAEARAVASATGKTRLLIVPANPSRQRVVRNGKLFVQDQPLQATALPRPQMTWRDTRVPLTRPRFR